MSGLRALQNEFAHHYLGNHAAGGSCGKRLCVSILMQLCLIGLLASTILLLLHFGAPIAFNVMDAMLGTGKGSGEALTFTTLPLGCVASCMPQGAANNASNWSLPGMPDALPPECSAIHVDNCTNACTKLAEDVVMDQTLLGMLVYYVVVLAPLFSIKAEASKLKARLQFFVVGEGAINAAVLSWRLLEDLFSALGEEDTACLWPHPYYDGASFLLDAPGQRLSILLLVALCPVAATTLQQGLLLPLSWYWANWGREMEQSPGQRMASGSFSCLVVVLLAPTVFLCLVTIPGVLVVQLFAFPVFGILATVPFFSNRLPMVCWIALGRCKHATLLRKAEEGDPDAQRQLPMYLAEDWGSWYERAAVETRYNPVCDSNRPFTSRLYLLFWNFAGMSVFFGSLTEWGVFLMSWQRSLPAKENASSFEVYTAFTSEYLDDAYLRFYGRFTLPHYLENFISPEWWAGLHQLFGIDLQLFIAVLNSIILFALSFDGCCACCARSTADEAAGSTSSGGSPVRV